MNKTITINLGGIFFHIDENAFKKLKHYLDAIAISLNDDPQGKDEIIKDIEQRISELLSEKIKEERQVINEINIDEIISIMGQPEDYVYDDELFSKRKTTKSGSKKMYRDGKDKILGGVSSGLGYYFGIDSAWVRIFWIIITLFYGTGLLAYIILWIILPEANSTAEELEMKGEAVNIGNIERSIKEEYSKLENKVKNADYSKVKTGFQDFLETMGRILIVFFKVLGMIIGILLIIIAATTLIGLIIGLFSWGSIEILGMGDQYLSLPPFFEHSIVPAWILTSFLFLALIIPFAFLFILGLNILSKDRKSLGLAGNLSLLGIWLVSLIGLTFAGIEHSNQFSSKASISNTYEYTVTAKDTLQIKMHGNDKIANRKSLYRSRNLELVEDSLGTEKMYSSNIHLDIRKSSTDDVLVKVTKTTKALNKHKAKENAKLISYSFTNNGTILDLDAFFLVPLELENSRPKIDIIIYVPEDRYVFLDNTTQSFLYDVKNKQDIYDADMANHYFYMSSEGFECTDCNNKTTQTDTDKIDKEGDNIDINDKGIKVFIKDGKDQVKVKIDKEGIEVR